MARWDEILSLPVQSPPTLEFSSADIVWSKVEGWHDNKDRVALIPFARVDDFLRGESVNKECPTRFHVEARRRRQAKTPYKPKVDGVLEYILYVQRQERIIRRSRYELDADDAVSISMWVENHQSNVFYYEDFSDVDPFTLGIQTDWQLQQMIRFGNRSLLASDSRFGTNKLKYSVHSLLVFNDDNRAIPVAWIVAPKFESSNAHKWMRALYNRVQTKDPAWKLAGFIVDDPLADVLTIRDVFQCLVLISFWRVRHAWHKNIVKKCVDNEMRAAISRRFHQAMDNICQQRGTEGLFEDFIEDFLDESDFMDYFKATWYPRIGMWISALQNLPLASQETCAAMEFYHNQLKLRLLNEKKPSVYTRVDWLVDKLGTKVHSYFWLDEYSEKDDFARYWKDEWVSGLTSWRKALKIPDSNVVMEGTCAKVINQLDQDRAYLVWNPGSQFGICNCSWAEMGNLCEHVLKVISVCRKKSAMPSISLLQYHQALIDMLHCPPHDSLIRDHAVSLAVFVQNQLNGLVNLESCNTTMDVTSFADRDRELVNEEVVSHNENDCGDGHVTAERTKGKLGTEQSNLVARGSGICNESCGEEVSCDEMDVDPSSICISPPGLYSVDEVVSSSVFSGSRQRSLFNTETEDLASTDDPLTNPTGYEDDILNRNRQENAMDEDIDIPSSTMEFVEQCTLTHPDDDHIHDIEHTVICKTSDDNTVYNKISPSASIPVESQVVEVAETSGVITGNEQMETEGKNGMEFAEQCTVTDPNDLHCNDIEPTVRASGNNIVDSKTLPSASVPVESQVVEVSEASESDRIEIESKNGSTSNHRSSVDDAITIDGVRDNLINGSDCSQYSNAAGTLMVVQGESLLKCSLTSSYNEEHLPVENGDTETVSSEKPSLITESHLTRTKLQNGAESINSNNGLISQPVANAINTTAAEGTTSMETAEAF